VSRFRVPEAGHNDIIPKALFAEGGSAICRATENQLDPGEKIDLLISLFLVCFASYEKFSNRSHRDYRVDN
jgi:hypothetical protein